MELRHLRYFVSVAEALSFTKAAEKLHTAQPSLTRQIKDLEEELGVRLLNRTKQQVTLTDEGAHFSPTPNAFLLSQPKLSRRSGNYTAATFARSVLVTSAISFTIFCRRLSLPSISRFPPFRLIFSTCRAVSSFARLKMASSILVSLDYTSQLRGADWNSERLRPTRPSPPCPKPIRWRARQRSS